jgi:hypothetical protein
MIEYSETSTRIFYQLFGLKPIQNFFPRLKKFLDLFVLFELGNFVAYISFIYHEIYMILELLRGKN